MSDFQTLASETASKLSTLADETETTQTSLIDTKNELARIRQQYEEAWEGLGEHAQSLIEQVNGGKTELATEVESVTQVIHQLQQTIGSTQDELTQELAAAKGAIAAIDDKLSELDFESDLEEAEDALEALGDQEIGAEVEESITQAVEELSGFGGELTAFQSGLEEQVDGLEAAISEQAVPAIEAGAETLTDHLDGLIEHFDTEIQTVTDGMDDSMQGLIGAGERFPG